MKTVLDKAAAIQAAMNTTVPKEKRSPNGVEDFGDLETVGLQLKRRNYRLGVVSQDGNEPFGVFLGEHPEGWAVFVWDVMYQPTQLELFNSLEALKEEWILD